MLGAQRQHPRALAGLHPAQRPAREQVYRGTAQGPRDRVVILGLTGRGVEQFQDGSLCECRRITAKEGRGGVQRVAGADPHDIEEQTVGLAGISPGAAAEHLLIEHRTLRGPRHNDAVD